MDLVCASAATTVGLMVTVYFVGFAIGGLLYTLPDKLGRKKALLVGGLLSALG